MTFCLLCLPHPPTQRLTHNTPESKKKRPCTADGSSAQDGRCNSVPLTSSYHPQPYSSPAGLLQFVRRPRTSEDEGQQHISVIQATGVAVSTSPSPQSRREAGPLAFRSSPGPVSFSSSSKPSLTVTSAKHFHRSTSQKRGSASSSAKPPALCSPKKSVALCSLKPPFQPSLPKTTPKDSHKPKYLMPANKRDRPADHVTESSGNFADKSALQFCTSKLKQVSWFVLHGGDFFSKFNPKCMKYL